jgi:hypothetical protein
MTATIGCNSLGFYLFEFLPRGKTFNAERYRDNILAGLIPLRPEAGGRELVSDADNAMRFAQLEYGLITRGVTGSDLASIDRYSARNLISCFRILNGGTGVGISEQW